MEMQGLEKMKATSLQMDVLEVEQQSGDYLGLLASI